MRVAGCADGVVPEHTSEQGERGLFHEERVVLLAGEVPGDQMLPEVRSAIDGRVGRGELPVADHARLPLERLERRRVQHDVEARVAAGVDQSPLVLLARVVEHREVRCREHRRGADRPHADRELRKGDKRCGAVDDVHRAPARVVRGAAERRDIEKRARVEHPVVAHCRL